MKQRFSEIRQKLMRSESVRSNLIDVLESKDSLKQRLKENLQSRRLEKLIKEKWEVSNFWTNLIWEGAAMDLAHDSKLSTSRINEVLGFAECLRHPIFMRYSHKDEKSLRADAKRIGISLGKPITKQGRPYAHLHFMSGDLAAPLPEAFSITKGGLFSIIGSKPLPRLI